MFEARCPTPKCKKTKLAELGRKPISEFTYSKACKCGKEVKGKISINEDKNQIIASLNCSCGYKKDKVVGHLVAVKCKKCKKITKF